ncbi:MAG: hypothetical protein RIC55_24145 [Pirellulaceae bacterium]
MVQMARTRVTFALVVVVLFAPLATGQEGLLPALPEPAPPMAVPTPPRDGRVHVMLAGGTHLVGKLEGIDEIPLDSLLGEVAAPLKHLEALRFTQRSKVLIEFRNGDRITGTALLPKLKLTAEWGDVEVESRHVEAIFSHERFQASTAAGTPYASDNPAWGFTPTYGHSAATASSSYPATMSFPAPPSSAAPPPATYRSPSYP